MPGRPLRFLDRPRGLMRRTGESLTAEALDRKRLRRLAGGDVEALAEIYDAHAERLFGLAAWLTGRRADAEDVVQETMLKLAGMGAGLLSVRRPRAYFLKMIRNAALDRRRRGDEAGVVHGFRAPSARGAGAEHGFGELSIRGAGAGHGGTSTRGDAFELHDPSGGSPARGRSSGADDSGAVEAMDLRAAIGRLPAEQREVVFLHAIEGLTFREVGRVTEVSTFTAASRYRLALRRLREALDSEPAIRPVPEES